MQGLSGIASWFFTGVLFLLWSVLTVPSPVRRSPVWYWQYAASCAGIAAGSWLLKTWRMGGWLYAIPFVLGLIISVRGLFRARKARNESPERLRQLALGELRKREEE